MPNLGDMLKLENNETFKKESIDLLCGGTPCQSFSVAGLRGGLADVRGNLALEFCRILFKKQPRWFFWENVPGALSTNEGADLATIFNAFSACGYSFSWRILDAKHFGVAQRRRRLFVVGHIGNDWRPSAAVLFERESLFRNIKAGGQTWEDIAGTLDAGAGRRRGAGQSPGSVVPWPADQAPTLDANFAAKQGQNNQHAQQGAGLFVPYNVTFNDTNGKRKDRPNGGLYVNETEEHTTLTRAMPAETLMVGSWWDGSQTAQCLDSVLYKGQTMPDKNRFPAVLQPTIFNAGMITQKTSRSNLHPGDCATLGATEAPTLLQAQHVRRITPLEAERLQGFPDNYTNIKGAKDSPRYKAIGNSQAVPVMGWIAERLDKVDKIFHPEG